MIKIRIDQPGTIQPSHLFLNLRRLYVLFLKGLSESSLPAVFQWRSHAVGVEILLIHFIRVQLLLLHRTGHLLLVRERLPLLADEELTDVGSFVEKLVVDSFVRLDYGGQV